MASFLASTCWPTRFFAKWLALFFGASLTGLVLSWFLHRHPAVKPPAPPVVARVQVDLKAIEIYSDGTRAAVPALVSTGGTGDKPIPESDQGALSVSKHLTAISRMPGSKLWLIFQWQGHSEARLINPWPHSTITYQVEFRLNRPHPPKSKNLITKNPTAKNPTTAQRRAERSHA